MDFQKICIISLKIFIFIFLLLKSFEIEKFILRLSKSVKSIKTTKTTKAVKSIKSIKFIIRNLTKLLRKIKVRNNRNFDISQEYNNSIDMPNNPNDPLIEKEREIILKKYGLKNRKSNISIFFDLSFPFGNQLTVFNKMIFFCEIIRCKNIILPKDNNLFINHTLYDKEHNLKIQVGLDDFFNVQVLSSISPEFFYDFYTLKIDNRVDVFKKEILNNLPKVKVSKNDLIIHFRSSDIFQHVNDSNYAPDYAQPPLCFYETILQKFKFDKIYIISADDIYNPVIKKLKKKYPRIIYHNNPLDVDISFLARGYKIVGSISSFLISSIKLNNNLKYLWEYDIYPMSGKLYHFHHLLFNIKRKYIIYQMKPSNVYKNKMIVWKCSKEQLKIMLNDKCSNNFKIIKPNVT